MNPYYYGYSHAGTNASIMLLDRTHGYWAQIGRAVSKMEDGSTTKRQIFTEYFLSISQNYFRFWSPHPLQTQTNYKIATWPQTPLYFYVDNSSVANYGNIVPHRVRSVRGNARPNGSNARHFEQRPDFPKHQMAGC